MKVVKTESVSGKRKRHWVNSSLIALAVAAITCLCWLFPSMRMVEEPLYNLTPRTIRETKSDPSVAVILLKDTDLDSHTQAVPGGVWSGLVDKLNKEMAPSGNGSPRILFFDYFYFFGMTGWKERESFKKAVSRFNGSVAFSGLALTQSTQNLSSGKSAFVMPDSDLCGGHAIGISNIPIAEDGIVQYVHWDYHQPLRLVPAASNLSAESGGLPAFQNLETSPGDLGKIQINHWAESGVAAYMLYARSYGKVDPDAVIPTFESHFGQKTHSITLRYPRMTGGGALGDFFPEYSVSEVLTDKLEDVGITEPPSQVLRHAHVVFVGDDRTIRQPLRGTPAGPVPATFIPAVVFWDLFHRQFVYPISVWVQWLVILLLSFSPVVFLNLSVPPPKPFAAIYARLGLKKIPAVPRFLIFLAAFSAFDFYVVRGEWAYDLALIFPLIASVVSFAGISLYRSVSAEGDVSKTVELLSRYLSPELAEAYRENPEDLHLGGRLDEVTVLFCDVRGFTSASEKLPPHDIVGSVKAYYDAAGSAIIDKGGFLAKFIGDAIMGVFSEPYPKPDDPVRAVEAALAILTAVEKLNAGWIKEGRDPWRIGIGINTGNAVWGAMGFKGKEELTIIGDSVNVASRLEELTKEYQVPIILSGSTYEALGEARGRYRFRHLGETTVRGRDEKISIWTVGA